MTLRRFTFYTRRACHLCDSAKYVLQQAVAGRDDVIIEDVDVDTDPQLAARFGYHVPVVFLDGREIARHRLDAECVRQALERPA